MSQDPELKDEGELKDKQQGSDSPSQPPNQSPTEPPTESKRRSLFVPTALITLLVAGNAATGYYASLEHERLKRTERRLTDLDSERKQAVDARVELETQLQQRLTAGQQREFDLKAKLNEYKSQSLKLESRCQSLMSEHQQLSKERQALSTMLEQTKEEEAELRAAIKIQVEKSEKLQSRIEKISGEYTKLDQNFRHSQKNLASLAKQFKGLQGSLKEFEGIIESLQSKHGINVRRRVGLSQPPKIKGRVLDAQHKQWPAILTINVGTRDKLEFDDLVYIHRGQVAIGEARVTKLTEKRSVAQVTRLYPNQKVLQGDEISTYPPDSSKPDS